MRELTFKGFLTQYVKDLSYGDTQSMKKLVHEAETDNYRLRAPLVLYTVETGQENRMRKNVQDSAMLSDLSLFSRDNLETMLQNGEASEPYLKVWNSYLVAKNAAARDEALKDAMRKKILDMQLKSNCSNYRIYKDLNLNPGNINHWLKHGDGRKVSYKTAERIMSYLMER